jgi:hypothetical protein
VTHDCDFEVTIILNNFIDDFFDNIYVLDYDKKNCIARENISSLHQEENEEAILPSKLMEEGIFHLHHPHVIIIIKLIML